MPLWYSLLITLIRAVTAINAWRRRGEAVRGEGAVPVGFPQDLRRGASPLG